MGEKKKILVVEDEAIHAMYLRIMLTNSGFDIVGVAASGDDVFKCMETNIPDIVLMDINLRDSIDGIEITNILRRKYSFPVIFISGFNDAATLERINKINSTWVMSKPLNENELKELLNKILLVE
jgi:DNA-binding NarL/FixJ family response regulator